MEFQYRGNAVARRGTTLLGDLTIAQYRLGPLGTGVIGGAIQFTGTATSSAPGDEFIFRRDCLAAVITLVNPGPPNAFTPFAVPATPFADESFLESPQAPAAGAVTIDARTGALAAAGVLPTQDRTPSATSAIYDTDAPGMPIGRPAMVAAPVGTLFVLRIQFVEWIECRPGPPTGPPWFARSPAWTRVCPNAPWYIRKTYEKTAMGAPGTWTPVVLPITDTMVLGATSGAAGQTFPLPGTGTPFPIVAGSLVVSVGGAALPAAAVGLNPATMVVTITPAQPAGRQVTATFQRPTFNDIGPGTIIVNF